MKATGARLLGAIVAVALVGCGSGARPVTNTVTHSVAAGSPPSAPGQSHKAAPRRTITLPAPGPTGIAAGAGAVRVIRGWADALRRGDVRGAARYFALPSTMISGIGPGGTVSVLRIHTPLEADYANASLPCGATFLSADQRGRYVNALFRLTGRPGPGGDSCTPGAGQTARTNFVIRRGRIVEWIRAPDDPGDNPRPQHPSLVPPTPVV
jgi:hypothetical protein